MTVSNSTAVVPGDSHFVRSAISDTLENDDIEVIGEVRNGGEAVARVVEHASTVVTSDVEIPKMGGIESELEQLWNDSRFIQKGGDLFSVREEVTKFLCFEEHHLIQCAAKHESDLLLCRNLIISIDTAYGAQVFDMIRRSLRSGGILMVATTETIPAVARETFEPVDKYERIYRRT